MITLNSVTKKVGTRLLFEDVTMTFNVGCRYGLTGPNGAGKSTLLKIIMGHEEPTSGSVSLPKKIGFLKQNIEDYAECKVVDTVIMGNDRLWKTLEERDRLYGEEMTDQVGIRLGELEEIIGEEDGYTAESDAEVLLEGMGIPIEFWDQDMKVIPTDIQFRVMLCQALFGAPEALILDEPTNHLDLESITWLETFLKGYNGTLIVVSHDRFFLNTVTTDIADIDFETIIHYPGNYDDMVVAKTSVRERAEHENKAKEKKIAQLRQFVAKFSAGTRASQVQSRMREIEKLQPTELKKSSVSLAQLMKKNFQAAAQAALDGLVLNAPNLLKAVLYKNLTAAICQMKKYKEEKQTIEKVLAADPTNEVFKGFLFNLAQEGRYDKYLEAVQIFKVLNPANKNQAAIFYLILGGVQISQGKIANSIIVSQMGLAANPTDENLKAKLYTQLLGALWKSGEKEKALQEAQDGLKLKPTDVNLSAPIYLILSNILHAMGKNEEALQVAQDGLKLNLTDIDSKAKLNYCLGHAKYHIGDFEGSLAAFQTGLDLNPTDNNLKVILYTELVWGLFNRGEYQKAQEAAQAGLALAPSNESLKQLQEKITEKLNV